MDGCSMMVAGYGPLRYKDKAKERLIPSQFDSQGRVLAYTIPDDQLLLRFLIMGSEVGNFYATAHELTEENAECVGRLIRNGHGAMVVEKVVEVVRNGRCIRLNTALLVLALCCRSDDPQTKLAAYQALLEVCKIPTHLFMFINHMKALGPEKKKPPKKKAKPTQQMLFEQEKTSENNSAGWGRSLRKAVMMWYNQFADNPQRLAMLVTKYQQREGWSHTDVLRLCHAKPVNREVGFILRYVVHGMKKATEFYMEDGKCDMLDPQFGNIVKYLQAVEELKTLEAPPCSKEGEELEEQDDSVIQRVIELVQKFALVREHIPTAMLRFSSVWESLLQEMPMMAMIRSLNKMTMVHLFDDPNNLDLVLKKLNNREALKFSKVHPYAILVGWHTYMKGQGMRGKLKWEPVPEICNALEQAFYAAFGNVQPSNKRILVAIDVSESMDTWYAASIGTYSAVTARIAAAAMSLVTVKVEPNVDVVAFSDTLVPIPLKEASSLEQAITTMKKFTAGKTDCGLPMVWAKENKKEYDAFIIYTDCETWYSVMPPAESLKMYRRESGIENARLAVVAMSTSAFTLADPEDVNMLDVVGFDTDTPSILQQFLEGVLVD